MVINNMDTLYHIIHYGDIHIIHITIDYPI